MAVLEQIDQHGHVADAIAAARAGIIAAVALAAPLVRNYNGAVAAIDVVATNCAAAQQAANQYVGVRDRAVEVDALIASLVANDEHAHVADPIQAARDAAHDALAHAERPTCNYALALTELENVSDACATAQTYVADYQAVLDEKAVTEANITAVEDLPGANHVVAETTAAGVNVTQAMALVTLPQRQYVNALNALGAIDANCVTATAKANTMVGMQAILSNPNPDSVALKALCDAEGGVACLDAMVADLAPDPQTKIIKAALAAGSREAVPRLVRRRPQAYAAGTNGIAQKVRSGSQPRALITMAPPTTNPTATATRRVMARSLNASIPSSMTNMASRDTNGATTDRGP